MIYVLVFSTAPTDPPRNVIATNKTSRSIILSWDTITCTERNGMITSYTVEIGQTGNTTTITNITELTFSTNELTPFTNYTFRVAGVNSAGTGVYSNIITNLKTEDSKNALHELFNH